jgi:hypothetical protein
LEETVASADVVPVAQNSSARTAVATCWPSWGTVANPISATANNKMSQLMTQFIVLCIGKSCEFPFDAPDLRIKITFVKLR